MTEKTKEITHQHRSVILYVDDEKDNLELFRLQFGDEYELITANSAKEGLEILKKDSSISIILTDERMPEMTGIEFLEQIVTKAPDTIRIIVSAYSDSQRLLNALNRGRAHEYIVKPWRRAEVRKCLESWLTISKRRQDLNSQADLASSLLEEIQAPAAPSSIIGEKGGLADVLKLSRKVAKTDTSVLIRGETGTGKEMAARFIHDNSPRSAKPFIRVNCAALSETLLESELFGHEKGAFTGATNTRMGRFELANGGTIFLDEIGDISQKLQVMLLRVLQEREIERVGGIRTINVNVRIVAATNRDLETAVAQGQFREDLFYRLNVFPIFLPPLRERAEDIADLLDWFLQKYQHLSAKKPTIAPGLIEALQTCDWPGNIREFENLVQRALVVCEGSVLESDHFYFDFAPAKPKVSKGTVKSQVKTKQYEEMKASLEKHEGNCSKAARELGLARTTLMSRAKKLGLL
jgi:DNA-binding NtrC family response regulator